MTELTQTYEARTQGVIVRVTPSYLPGQSDPQRSRYVWAYEIEIENAGERTIQLVSRHWIITDGLGRVEEVEGPGVVGEQPILRAGERHRYVSGCPLTTPSGAMVGTFRMLVDGGEPFDAAIPAFSLDVPGRSRTLN
jgi:ApaG protein